MQRAAGSDPPFLLAMYGSPTLMYTVSPNMPCLAGFQAIVASFVPGPFTHGQTQHASRDVDLSLPILPLCSGGNLRSSHAIMMITKSYSSYLSTSWLQCLQWFMRIVGLVR